MPRSTVLAENLERANVTAADLQGALNAGAVRGASDRSEPFVLVANAEGDYESWSAFVGTDQAGHPVDDTRGMAIHRAFVAGYIRAAIEHNARVWYETAIKGEDVHRARANYASGDSATNAHRESEALADRPSADY